MKKMLLVTASVVALGAAAPAFGEDLAARPYTKAPPMVSPVYNWSGFYVGINGGGASSRNCWDMTSIIFTAIPATSEGCHDATGGLVGGQIGYCWQASNWVFGLEAQGDWADLKGSNTSAIGVLTDLPYVNETKIEAIGLFTGQVGYAWNNVLWL